MEFGIPKCDEVDLVVVAGVVKGNRGSVGGDQTGNAFDEASSGFDSRVAVALEMLASLPVP